LHDKKAKIRAALFFKKNGCITILAIYYFPINTSTRLDPIRVGKNDCVIDTFPKMGQLLSRGPLGTGSLLREMIIVVEVLSRTLLKTNRRDGDMDLQPSENLSCLNKSSYYTRPIWV
jgi:hypothetical protein